MNTDDDLTKPATSVEIADTLLLFDHYLLVITGHEFRERVQRAKLVVRRMAFELDQARERWERERREWRELED